MNGTFIRLLSVAAVMCCTVRTWADVPPTTVIGGKTYYELDSQEALIWFGDYVYCTDNTVNAVLTADITPKWHIPPIGICPDENLPSGPDLPNERPFTGIFDGQGHVINGAHICMDDYNTEQSGRDYSTAGFFGAINGGTVKNLILSNVMVSEAWRTVAGMCAKAENAIFINCAIVGSESLSRRNTSLSVDGCGFVAKSTNTFSKSQNIYIRR